MDIYYGRRGMRRIFESEQELIRRYGPERSRVIQRRLVQLKAAENLHAIGHLPPMRCHALSGDRKGQFAVDGGYPFRLIFEPAHDPLPVRSDGGPDRERITAIRILEVVDYHGE